MERRRFLAPIAADAGAAYGDPARATAISDRKLPLCIAIDLEVLAGHMLHRPRVVQIEIVVRSACLAPIVCGALPGLCTKTTLASNAKRQAVAWNLYQVPAIEGGPGFRGQSFESDACGSIAHRQNEVDTR